MNWQQLLAIIFGLALLFGIAACSDDDDAGDDSGPAADDDSQVDDDAIDDDVADDDAADDDTADDDTTDDDTVDDDTVDDDTVDDDTVDDDTGEYWEPSTVVPVDVYPEIRGLTVQRGIIHLHSVYSHDGCDNRPFINGHPNWECLEQLRTAMCTTKQNFIMLTDHDDPFSYYEFPDVLLYQEENGDELIYDGEAPIANIIHCPDDSQVILTAGNENDVMPIHLERMPDGTPEERMAVLGSSDVDSINTMYDLGATVYVNHAEQWEAPDLLALPIHGMEVYNLHANILPEDTLPLIENILNILAFIFPYAGSGDSDLVLLSFLAESTKALDNFDKVLAERPAVSVMGTDAHRNSLPFPLWDGDRADSYRRMMRWFANYVLVLEPTLEDYELAIDDGRMYGAFQVFGEPVGFDYHAALFESDAEMGETVSLANDSPGLEVKVPEFYNMDPSLPPPEFRLTIVKAGADGGTVVAESTDEDLVYVPTSPGAYRAEVHVVPYHLEKWLGDNADMFLKEYPLIYANPIYVVD